MNLIQKIESKTALVGIVGIGHIGKSLGQLCFDEGFQVKGLDIDLAQVEKVNRLKKIAASSKAEDLKECDVLFITVETLLDREHKPDIRPLKEAVKSVASILRKNQLIVVESTIAPGMTREEVLPILEQTKLIAEKDFFLAYSPQRIDFGNKNFTMKNTPKVISGIGDQSLKLIKSFYSQIIDQVIPVSSIEVAEFSKMLENIFRFVNINLINELTEYAIQRGIDIWETINAASTKPYGFSPFYPGPGISGNCIPINPYYLLEDAKKAGKDLEILKTSMHFHEKRIEQIVDKVFEILGENKPSYHILLVGITMKAESDDIRSSIALKIWKLLEAKGAVVNYHDPFVPKMGKTASISLEKISDQDLIVILTDHHNVDYQKILLSKKPIIDMQNVYKETNPMIIKL